MVYLLALYMIGGTSHVSVLFVCCLFLIRAPVPAYEGSCREEESQVPFGVRTQELKEFCHEIKEGGNGFNYLPWRLRDRITKETH